jgi:protein-tyrosine phosphatase
MINDHSDLARRVEFRVLYVCTANMIRSPIAERITRMRVHACAGDGWIRVGSAGMRVRGGMPMHPIAAETLRALGAESCGFRTRRLDRSLVEDSDLLLTACLEHRDAAVALHPAASRRTFLLREFVRLVRHVPRPYQAHDASDAGDFTGHVTQALGIVTAAARLRGRIPWQDPLTDEISDPAVTDSGLLASAAEIDEAVTEMVEALTGSAWSGAIHRDAG